VSKKIFSADLECMTGRRQITVLVREGRGRGKRKKRKGEGRKRRKRLHKETPLPAVPFIQTLASLSRGLVCAILQQEKSEKCGRRGHQEKGEHGPGKLGGMTEWQIVIRQTESLGKKMI